MTAAGSTFRIRVPVAPLLHEPRLGAALDSELLHGETVTSLVDRGDGWHRVRCPDDYEGWTHEGYLVVLDSWQPNAMVVDSLFAVDEVTTSEFRLSCGSRVIMEDSGIRIIGSNLLKPRTGAAVRDVDRASRFPAHPGAISGSMLRWLETPYRWGGRTQRGVDCSGYVQTVFGLHGIPLPRDSWMQASMGQAVDPAERSTGDLLFFSEDGDRITHVAMAIDRTRIIHAALANGRVAVDDLAAASGFGDQLRARLKVVRRVIPAGAR